MFTLAALTLEEGAITLIIGAIGAYIGLKILVVELRVKVNNLSSELDKANEKAEKDEVRIRELEIAQAVTESKYKDIFNAIEKVGNEIKESKGKQK